MKTKIMSLVWYCMVAMCLQVFTSCESVPESVSINGKDVEIVGVEPSQLVVSDELYQLNQRETSKGSGLWLLTMRAKFLSRESVADTGDAVLQLMDEKGDSLTSLRLGENSLDTKTAADFRAFMSEGGDGEQRSVCFFHNTNDKEEVARIMQQATSFKITGIL